MLQKVVLFISEYKLTTNQPVNQSTSKPTIQPTSQRYSKKTQPEKLYYLPFTQI
jgi:hypothetical protein